MAEISWGIFLAAYLFVGGLAGGAFVIAALADILGKGKYRELSKSGTYVSLISILLGFVFLVADLGRFDVDPLGILNAFIHFPTSIMSVGTWIISAFTIVALLTSVIWFFRGLSIVRKLLELVGIVLGGSTMAYTGLLLALARGRPFWASPFLPWTFILSGSLTGLVMALLFIPIIAWFIPRFFNEFKELFDNRRRFTKMLVESQKYVMILIIFELALVLIEVGLGHAGALFNIGSLSLLFFVYIVLGLIIPLGIAYYSRKREYRLVLPTTLISFIFVLIGGFLLRYVILTAGQLIL